MGEGVMLWGFLLSKSEKKKQMKMARERMELFFSTVGQLVDSSGK